MDTPTVTTPRPSIGFATIAGVLFTIVAGAGAFVAAVKGNDTATAAGAAAGVLTAVTTLGGRYAQAVVIARRIAGPAARVLEAVAGTVAPAPVVVNAYSAGDASSSSSSEEDNELDDLTGEPAEVADRDVDEYPVVDLGDQDAHNDPENTTA